MNKKSFLRILLELSVFMCVAYTTISTVSFIHTRIPPYREGKCFSLFTETPGIQLKVLKNNLIYGYSDLEAYTFIAPDFRVPVRAYFTEIRNSLTKETQCGFGAPQ